MDEPRNSDLPHGPDGVDWDDFRVFLEIVRSRSFNRAAAKLKMTQPTVSRRLARLEETIGVRLFDRDRRGPRLTADGQRIYSEAFAAQAALMRATNQVPGTERQVVGDCKIFMGEGVATYWVSRFLASFFTRHPNVELKVFGANDPTADKRQTFDLHVQYYEPLGTEAVTARLATLHFLPFASREYLRIHGVPQTVEALSRHRLLDLAVYLSDMGSWASWLRGSTNPHALLFTNLTGCLAESVRCGAGIALLPTYAVLVDDCLVPIQIGVHFMAPMLVSYHRDALKKWPVRATLDFLRNHVFDKRNMPWFREAYVAPQMDWSKRLATFVDRAAAPIETDKGMPEIVD